MLRLLSTGLLLLMMAGAMAQVAPHQVSLDGQWLFRVDSTKTGVEQQWFLDSLDRSSWETVETPRYWEGYPGLATYDGWGWFSRTFFVENTAAQMSLHFAGVDDDAVVWVNEKEVGSHSGYSDPFVLDVSGAVRRGKNTIAVLVKDYAGGGGIYKPITLVPTAELDDLLRGPFSGTPALKSADWVRDATIYSVYLRSSSPEGTFAGLEKRLPELRDLGVSVLWLMPIHPVGMEHRKGTLGSPYSVRDYYGINPEFGTLDDFRRLLAAAHRNGMHLIIDLVANHTSWDNRLVTEHSDWYTKSDKGEIVAPNPDWADVCDLDYGNAGLRQYMVTMMRWWVKDVGIDGFRCDVAELVPTDFWEEARQQLNRIKPVMMLAEGSLPEHHVKAFDLSYSWNVYDALDPLLQEKRPVALIDQLLKNEKLQFPLGSLRMRFTTNHDKNAWDAPAVLKFGLEGLTLATVLVNTLPGVPMIYTGEEVANDEKLSLFEKVGVDWSRPHAMGDLWKSLFSLRRNHKALSRGDMIRVSANPEQKVYSFIRVAGSDKVLVVLNFSSTQVAATLDVPLDRVFPGQKGVRMSEAFGRGKILLQPAVPLTITLEGRGYRVYTLN